MAEPVNAPVDLDGPSYDMAALNAELDQLTKDNEATQNMIRLEYGLEIPDVELRLRYMVTLLEHLCGSWELPKARLRYQRVTREMLAMLASNLARAKLAGVDLPSSPAEILTQLPNREQRRHPAQG